MADWQNIDDEAALFLIKEMMDNLSNDSLLEKNGDALEKKYCKSTGFVSDLIFQSGIANEFEILRELKKDTTFYL